MRGRKHAIIVTAGLVLGLALAAPISAAMSFGAGQTGVQELKNAGVGVAFAQIWVGAWIKSSGWDGVEQELRAARDQGVTPILLWYYWGDGISPNAVEYGSGGKTRGDWDWMAKDLAQRAKAIMGSKTFYVVLEPEFNKQGVQDMESFDGYLANQANIIKGAAPSARIIVGFGHWGGWDRFDRAMGAADHAGTQWMRGSTRDSAWSAENSAGEVLKVVKSIKTRFGKSVILYDFAISSYAGWEGVQAKAIKGFADRKGELEAAGLHAIVWRTVKDNDHSSGYYGDAEKNWGVKHSWGANKPAWDELVNLYRGGSTSTPPTSEGAKGSFSGVKGSEWWIEARVANSPWKVEVRVDNGPWINMKHETWGAWTTSTQARSGSVVEFHASFSGWTENAAFSWPSATPTNAVGGSTSSGSSAPANPFSQVTGNDWWIQANVAGSPAKVESRVNGGAWQGMKHEIWGAWTLSTRAADGSRVDIRATYGGETREATYTWRANGAPTAGASAPAPAAFSAHFENPSGNQWWVQIHVTSTKSFNLVEARVNGGAWVKLQKQDWGDWATAMEAPGGSKVEFRATSTDGAHGYSTGYTWKA